MVVFSFLETKRAARKTMIEKDNKDLDGMFVFSFLETSRQFENGIRNSEFRENKETRIILIWKIRINTKSDVVFTQNYSPRKFLRISLSLPLSYGWKPLLPDGQQSIW